MLGYLIRLEYSPFLCNGAYDRDSIRDLNIEGYFIWDLQKYIEEFTLKQLVKNGILIEERNMKMKDDEKYS